MHPGSKDYSMANRSTVNRFLDEPKRNLDESF
jgi:hypothetical protein